MEDKVHLAHCASGLAEVDRAQNCSNVSLQ